jgi:dimeric dUTPase (all-alpha-NTP-PPase superfamily)
MENSDKLNSLFQMQKALNARIGVDTDSMTEAEQIKWTLNYCRALSQELAELTDSVPWKWWAHYQKFDKQNAKVEIVDMLHFIISLAQVMGISADDMYAAYVAKNKINLNRQDTGYVVKDENDCKTV